MQVVKTNDTRRKWLTAYAPLIIWAVFTLGLGSGAASMNETSRFIRPLLEFLFPNAGADHLYIYHTIVRKLAHLFQYGILGLLAVRAFSGSRYRYLIAILSVVAVGSIDELNQSFDERRTGVPFDVVVDFIGGLYGLFAFWLFSRWRKEA